MSLFSILQNCHDIIEGKGFRFFCGWFCQKVRNRLLSTSVKANQFYKKRTLNASEQVLARRLKSIYFYTMGEKLNLEHPQTFNEKIQWLKLYDNSPIKTRLADKTQAHKWIKRKIGEERAVPFLGVWDNFDKIPFDSLPNRFMLKASHGSGWNYLVTEGGMQQARKKLKRRLSMVYGLSFLELHYIRIPPRIIAQPYIRIKMEYQFWCFNGTPKFVSCIIELHGQNLKASYSMGFKRLPFVTSLPEVPENMSKPVGFEEMRRIAGVLSEDFYFLRVDFLHDGERFYIGELTFFPAGGYVQWYPKEYDKIIGDALRLPTDGAENR